VVPGSARHLAHGVEVLQSGHPESSRESLPSSTWLPGLFDHFNYLFHDPGMQHFSRVEGHGDAKFTLSVDPMASLGTQKLKSGLQKEAFGF
jgi:hypothetical protein